MNSLAGLYDTWNKNFAAFAVYEHVAKSSLNLS